MALAVGDVLDERVVDPADVELALLVIGLLLQHGAHGGLLLHDVVDVLYNKVYDVDVLHLVVATHVVDLTVATLAHHEVDGLAVVLHVEPVAYVLALAVDGETLAFQNVVDHQRDELFGEVVGAVVV